MAICAETYKATILAHMTLQRLLQIICFCLRVAQTEASLKSEDSNLKCQSYLHCCGWAEKTYQAMKLHSVVISTSNIVHDYCVKVVSNSRIFNMRIVQCMYCCDFSSSLSAYYY